MTRKVACGASPLIYAARIGILRVFRGLYESVMIPKMVYEETAKKGLEKRAPDALAIKEAVDQGWIKVLALEEGLSREIEILVRLSSISRGEAEAIVLAEQEKADLLIMDEKAGTLTAKARGLRVTGLPGVIIEAMYKDLMTYSELKTYFDKLISIEFRLKHFDYVRAIQLARKARRRRRKP